MTDTRFDEFSLGLALSMRSISKRFPGTLAVDDVDFEVYAGEVHALVGENGAGKSTLMKIIAGLYNDYTGDIKVNDKECKLHSPSISKNYGIGMIYQELSLALPLTIAENILVGRYPKKGIFLDKKKMIKMSKHLLKRVGIDYLDPMTPVSEISQHEAQLVEIAKALGNNPCILVMDEPTSALSSEEVKRLFGIIESLKKQGIAVIYISHHLPEIYKVEDRVTGLRDGKKIGTNLIDEVTSEDLIEMMVGKSVKEFYAKDKHEIGDVLFEVDKLSRHGFFHNVSFNVKRGEILGIAGLAGAGRTELARCLVGLDETHEGDIKIEGKKIHLKEMHNALDKKIAYLTENRKTQGLALRMSVSENLLSALIPKLTNKGLYNDKKAKEPLKRLIEKLNIYPPDPSRMVSSLSGGNQQKVLLAKWLAIEPKVLILDEPTRGVDIGAKMLIHKTIEELAKMGNAIILISSDLPEFVSLSDRAMIMRNGHFIGEIKNDDISEESVLLSVNGEGEFVQ